jgi:hypothetical protein
MKQDEIRNYVMFLIMRTIMTFVSNR